MTAHSKARLRSSTRGGQDAAGPHATETPNRDCLLSPRREGLGSQCRPPPGSRRQRGCRYDEAGARLDVESPPARQPYSQQARSVGRQYEPPHLRRSPIEHGSQDPCGRSGAHGARSTKNRNDDATGLAQATPRAPEPKIRRSVKRGPYGDASKRLPDPHGYAYEDGSREPARGVGCSAGTSACPWPRSTLLEVGDASRRHL